MICRLEPTPTDTCVWMSAGVLSYKLCDRQFDCEHCPLDAALRGAPVEPGRELSDGPAARPRPAVNFPADRLYGEGHTWIQPQAGRTGRFRLGLDGFAASLVAWPRSVLWCEASRALRRDQPLCVFEFEEGRLGLRTPVTARVDQRNRALDENPGIVFAEPYGNGWIADLADVEASELKTLLSAEAARDRARLDLRRLRRMIALHLLVDQDDARIHSGGRGDGPPKPWNLLDGADYLGLIREVVC